MLAMTCPTERRRLADGQRGAVLIIVLSFILLFVGLGAGAWFLTQNSSWYAQNREVATQAFYAAEAAFHKALAQMMVDGSTINTAAVSVVETGYPRVQANAIIEAVGATHPRDYRVYARGVTGPMPSGAVARRYVRGYVRFSAATEGRTMDLQDWQEIPESVVEDHAKALPAGSLRDAYRVWFPDIPVNP